MDQPSELEYLLNRLESELAICTSPNTLEISKAVGEVITVLVNQMTEYSKMYERNVESAITEMNLMAELFGQLKAENDFLLKFVQEAEKYITLQC